MQLNPQELNLLILYKLNNTMPNTIILRNMKQITNNKFLQYGSVWDKPFKTRRSLDF